MKSEISSQILLAQHLIFICAIAILLFVSCNTTPAPLSEGAKNVTFAEGIQAVSIDLYTRCRPVGKVISIGHSRDPYILQRMVADRKGNLAQVLYADQKARHVRIWKCPDSYHAPKGGGIVKPNTGE